MTIREILARSPIVPVLTIDDAGAAVALARALLKGGIPVLEVTLRTAAALEAVRRIARGVPAAIVGVGTLTRAEELAGAIASGAAFAVSPGFVPTLARAVEARGLPYLPGVATASEVMAARTEGFSALKFFPAASAGGPAALRAMGAVFPDVAFCPTGGVGPDNLATYLGLANVIAVGGSWLAPPDRVAAGDWAGITETARTALARVTPAVAAR